MLGTLFQSDRRSAFIFHVRNSQPIRTLAATVAVSLALTLVPAFSASAAPVETPEPPTYTLQQFESELDLLEGLSDEELARVVTQAATAYEASTEVSDTPKTRVAPLVIVAAIGCGVSVIGSLATNSWSNANSAAWAIAGVLTSCIPGVAQASLVKTILANKVVIGRALKAVGLTAPALALCGSSTC